MPVDLLLDNERRIMRTHAFGFVTLEDFVDSMEKILQLMDGKNVDDNWAQIIDLTDVSSVQDLSEADIGVIAKNSPWPSGTRRAIIVTEESTLKLARIYQSLGKERGQQIKLVESIDEAEKWLEATEEA